MRLVIVAGLLLLTGFFALMALGGDSGRPRSDEQEAADFSPGIGMRILGAITEPFAPRVAMQTTRFAVGLEGSQIPVPAQTHDRQTLRLELTTGRAVVAVLACSEGSICGKPLCLILDGTRPPLCDERSHARAQGSLIVPREGGILTLRAFGTVGTVVVR